MLCFCNRNILSALSRIECAVFHISKRPLSTQRTLSNPLASEDPSVTAARQWLATFSRASIPNSTGEVSYARSSGPGGQNVNKSV